MSVIVECYSVIVKKIELERRYPGGLEAYAAVFPKVFCADEHLTRVGFMARSDLRGFAKHVLSVAGLGGGLEDGYFWVDSSAVAVVEQQEGVWSADEKSWLEYAEGGQKVCWCWLEGTEPGRLATPPGWYPDPTMTKVNLRGVKGTPVDRERHEGASPRSKDTIVLYQARAFPGSEDN